MSMFSSDCHALQAIANLTKQLKIRPHKNCISAPSAIKLLQICLTLLGKMTSPEKADVQSVFSEYIMPY